MKGSHKKRIIIGLLIVCIILVLRYLNIGKYISLESIKSNRKWLQNLIDKNFWLFVVGYVGTYAAAITLSLPVFVMMSIAGGFFFGVVRGALLANLGATLGSTVSFLLIRHLFGKVLHEKYKDRLRAFNREFKKYGYSYLLSLHFFLIVPLFVPNVLGGLANVSLWTFVWTTFVGMIPGTFIFAFAGKQLMTIQSLREVFSPQLILVAVFFLFLSLVPFFARWFKSWKRLRSIKDLSDPHL